MRHLAFFLSAVLALFSLGPCPAKASDFIPAAEANQPNREITKSFENIIAALGEGDYSAFMADSTPEFRKKLKPKAFSMVSDQLSPLIKGGYVPFFLTVLEQQGHEVYVWKISFRGQKSDLLTKLAIYEGKVAGFWIQ